MEAEVLRTFEDLVEDSDGTPYLARICGRPADGGRWQGWLEFVPARGGGILRSGRETTQPNRRNLEGWAGRLSRVYLEGSLKRTLALQEPKRRPPLRATGHPRFRGPVPISGRSRTVAPDDAALNPFLRYRSGEATFMSELHDLPTAELRLIVRAYHLAEDPHLDVDRLPRQELERLILRTVRERMLR